MFQAQGQLGCFCLTEKLAGVNSGLVVNTTCTWDESKQMFLLDCPNDGAYKNWISQGLSADMAVVIANLIVKGKPKGPHGFLMKIRQNGELVSGVVAKDMGDKTIGNDLDNAEIAFSQVWLPKESLLDKYAGIEGGEYASESGVRSPVPRKGVSNMDMIGQRLYTGRTVIAGSTLVFARSLYQSAKNYADNKKCWSPQGGVPLSSVPQLAHLYVQTDQDRPQPLRYGCVEAAERERNGARLTATGAQAGGGADPTAPFHEGPASECVTLPKATAWSLTNGIDWLGRFRSNQAQIWEIR
ncbi:Acyl-coenzyme A oxidase-like protein (Acyl-CoA oxidase-like protein) [Durusdinium trenchii]|uniref:Acyl-coenzyme A oxidase-like protein (Acyl-CoA oxidase-like protein) n=1 Tax=Durusdinium trenchii TaxID=1381693 RepID=A0ABP0PS93_9DINO